MCRVTCSHLLLLLKGETSTVSTHFVPSVSYAGNAWCVCVCVCLGCHSEMAVSNKKCDSVQIILPRLFIAFPSRWLKTKLQRGFLALLSTPSIALQIYTHPRVLEKDVTPPGLCAEHRLVQGSSCSLAESAQSQRKMCLCFCHY